MAKNGPSNWKFVRDDIYPHRNAIIQSNDITCKSKFDKPDGDCTATMLMLKFKKFYDFRLTIDFKVRKYGFFGILFRFYYLN